MSVVIFSFIFRNYGNTTGYPWVKRKCLRNLYACETLSIVTTRNIECISIKQGQRPLKVNGELYRQVDKTLEPSDDTIFLSYLVSKIKQWIYLRFVANRFFSPLNTTQLSLELTKMKNKNKLVN